MRGLLTVLRWRGVMARVFSSIVPRLFLLVAFGLAVVITIAALPKGRVMNCGGSSTASAEVRDITQLVLFEMAESADHSFQFSSAAPEAKKILSSMGRSPFLGKARFLLTTARISDDSPNYPQLVVVCDTPFRNIPERRFGQAPPAHAAGYSDGSARLMAAEEFAGLPKEQFVRLDELFPKERRGK